MDSDAVVYLRRPHPPFPCPAAKRGCPKDEGEVCRGNIPTFGDHTLARPADPAGIKTVFLVAGEASGDCQAAGLVEAIRQLRPGLRFLGVGGPLMRQDGVELLYDSSRWGIIGIGEGLRRAPALAWRLASLRRYLRRSPPDLLVLVDYRVFNMSLARLAHALEIRTLYYFPPGSWQRHRSPGELPGLVDAIATPFPWSRDQLAGGRARVEWVGHPLLDRLAATDDRRPDESASPDCRLPIAGARSSLQIALVPGSRPQEIRQIWPVILKAAAILARERPLRFLVPVAPTVSRARLEGDLARAGLTAVLTDGMDYQALLGCRLALATSGTATLELAALGVPMVVIYRGGWLTLLQWHLLVKRRARYAALPNLILEKEVVPELLGLAAKPERIAQQASSLLDDQQAWAGMAEQLKAVRECLGQPGASLRTARMAVELLP